MFAKQGPYTDRGPAERDASELRARGMRVRVQRKERFGLGKRGLVSGAASLLCWADQAAGLLPL